MCDSENSAFEQLVSGVTQVATLGTSSYDAGTGEGFQATGGVFGKPVVSALKDITGATAAEDATRAARDQFDKAKAEATSARKESKAQSGRDQLTASRLAGGARSGGTQKGSGSRFSSLGGDEADFLGL